MCGGLWNEWDRKWQGAPCFNGPEGCPTLWHVVAGNLRGRLRLCCQFAVAVAIASEDSRLAARAAIKGHLKTDLLLYMSISHDLWAVSISCYRPRGMNWGLCRGD